MTSSDVSPSSQSLTVIVTGASRGIGKEIASLFAQAGYRLLLTARDTARLQQTVTDLTQTYPHAIIHGQAADLSISQEAIQFGRWCLSYGEPDILINNAGQFLPGSLSEEPEGQLEQQLAVNLYSAYHLTRTLLPDMIQRGSGHIFTICSIASLKPYAQGGSYSISKYALHGFTQNLREELKPTGVKVTGVYPGAVLTDSWGDFDNSTGRILEPADIAKMIFQAAHLSPQACVEEIVIRPRLGDL
ncbi:MAG: SDR family oxidoreductase [Sphingomonadales bacterium]